MIDWIKTHWLFCAFAGVVLVLVIVLICVLAYQSKKEKELDEKPKKLVVAKRKDLDKKQEENLKTTKPLIKGNLRTGEKVKRNVKIKEQPQEEVHEEKQQEVQEQSKEQKEKVKKQKPEKQSKMTEGKEEKEQMKKEEKNPAKKAEQKKVEEKKESERYRVVFDKEQKNWVVKIDGGERASRRCATKEEALKVAKDLAKKKDADLSVHKKNGKFQKQ